MGAEGRGRAGSSEGGRELGLRVGGPQHREQEEQGQDSQTQEQGDYANESPGVRVLGLITGLGGPCERLTTGGGDLVRSVATIGSRPPRT